MKYHNPPAVYVSNLQLKTENLELEPRTSKHGYNPTGFRRFAVIH